MFYEFTRNDGGRFLIDFVSGWEIFDRGEKPAHWENNLQGRNMDCREPYEEVRAKLLPAILALRPQAVPMTRDVFGALKKVHETAVYLGAGECSITMDLVREIDAIFERSTAHHGITAPAGGEKQA